MYIPSITNIYQLLFLKESHPIKDNNILFDERFVVREDLEFILHCMTKINTWSFSTKCEYYYTQPDYVRKYSILNIDSDIFCTLQIMNFMKELKVPLKSALFASSINRISNNAILLYKNNSSINLINRVYKVVKNYIHLVGARYLEIKTILFYLLYHLGINLNSIIWKILKK